MNVAIIVFPGTNGEVDCYQAIKDTLTDGPTVEYVWHTATDLSKYDWIILPGGSSYGDYLRSGALASLSPVIDAVREAAIQGKYVLGIGNGFQILLESALLPGAMRPNETLTFRSQQVMLSIGNITTPFTCDYQLGELVKLPIAHAAGNYYCDEQTLNELKHNKQIVLSYEGDNPNGSVERIAGICNLQGNVVGMMPHPERATHQLLGSEDGKRIFTSVLKTWRANHDTAITD